MACMCSYFPVNLYYLFRKLSILEVTGLKRRYITYPMIPPATLVIRSVTSPRRKSFIKGCNISMLKLNKKVNPAVFNSLGLFCVRGSRNPNGTVIITFSTICRIKSPRLWITSVKGTRFMGTYACSKIKGSDVMIGTMVTSSTQEIYTYIIVFTARTSLPLLRHFLKNTIKYTAAMAAISNSAIDFPFCKNISSYYTRGRRLAQDSSGMAQS